MSLVRRCARCGTIVTHARITICIHIVCHLYLAFLVRTFYDLGGHFWASLFVLSVILGFLLIQLNVAPEGFSWASVPRCLITSLRYLAPVATPSSRPYPISPRPPHPPCSTTAAAAAAAAQWCGKARVRRGSELFSRSRECVHNALSVV